MHTAHEIPVSPFLAYCNARKHFYQFLQVLFYQPLTELSFTQLKEEGNLQDLQEFGQGGKLIYQFFNQATVNNLIEMHDDFNQLFVGPGSILAPPWGSVYRNREHLLFDKTTHLVRELYHEFGLQYIRENNEPDDHLVVELEFLLHLNELSMQEENQETFTLLLLKQIHFLEEHLSTWIPLFTEKIRKSAKTDLYKGAGLLLNDFLEFDIDSLKEFEEAMTNV